MIVAAVTGPTLGMLVRILPRVRESLSSISWVKKPILSSKVLKLIEEVFQAFFQNRGDYFRADGCSCCFIDKASFFPSSFVSQSAFRVREKILSPFLGRKNSGFYLSIPEDTGNNKGIFGIGLSGLNVEVSEAVHFQRIEYLNLQLFYFSILNHAVHGLV